MCAPEDAGTPKGCPTSSLPVITKVGGCYPAHTGSTVEGMRVVIARYTGPAVLSWETGQTPVLAHLSLREDQGGRWGLSGERTWSGELQDLDGTTAWGAFDAHRHDELTHHR